MTNWLNLPVNSDRRYICGLALACGDQCRTKPSPRSFPRPQARGMERAPGSHYLSRGPAQSAGDRICHPEDRCNTGRKPHVEPFAILSLSLSWWRSHANRALRKRVFHAHTLRAQPTKVRSTVTTHPQASVCRLGDCFLRPDFRAPLSWLAQTMCAPSRAPRASAACTRHARVDGAQLDRICRAPLERLHHHLARRGLEHHAVAAADGHRGQDGMSDGILSDYGNYSL